jgi:hypothetical protein
MSKAPISLTTNRWADLAQNWLDAKDDYEEAKADLSIERSALLEAVDTEGHPFVIVKTSAGDVAITEKDRRTFDVEKLANLLPLSLAATVTKVVVDVEAFDQAVKEGKISAKVVAKVTTSTPYVDVRKG